MENVGISYDHLEYFTAIWYNLWPFGIVCRHLVNFFQIWYVWKKNLAHLLKTKVRVGGQFGAIHGLRFNGRR
jgi:hypothetical protein